MTAPESKEDLVEEACQVLNDAMEEEAVKMGLREKPVGWDEVPEPLKEYFRGGMWVLLRHLGEFY